MSGIVKWQALLRQLDVSECHRSFWEMSKVGDPRGYIRGTDTLVFKTAYVYDINSPESDTADLLEEAKTYWCIAEQPKYAPIVHLLARFHYAGLVDVGRSKPVLMLVISREGPSVEQLDKVQAKRGVLQIQKGEEGPQSSATDFCVACAALDCVTKLHACGVLDNDMNRDNFVVSAEKEVGGAAATESSSHPLLRLIDLGSTCLGGQVINRPFPGCVLDDLDTLGRNFFGWHNVGCPYNAMEEEFSEETPWPPGRCRGEGHCGILHTHDNDVMVNDQDENEQE